MFKFQIDDELELRLLEISHGDKVFSLVDAGRIYLRQWLPWIDGTRSAVDTQAFIRSAKNQYASDNGFQAGMWYKGELVGIIGLHQVDWSNRSTSIGYWLSQQYQGKGIVTRSCRALLNHAFNELGLHRVEIRCAE
jgi:ribosomal-protein-serine acetyltransferase